LMKINSEADSITHANHLIFLNSNKNTVVLNNEAPRFTGTLVL